jgi:hypothetical protein
MNPFAFAATTLLSVSIIAPVEAQTFRSPETRVALLELYTSEGCSSCPPAEAWLGELRQSPRLWKEIVPVAFHVDYWDRLGWPDRLAKPEFSERQRRQAAGWGSRSVYTPGFAMNGREWRGWFQNQALPAGDGAKPGVLTVRFADQVEINFASSEMVTGKLQAEVALLGSGIEVNVKRGENAGRKLRHEFVVLDLQSAPLKKDGNALTATVRLPREIRDRAAALAAWVATGPAETPIQATGGWIKNP